MVAMKQFRSRVLRAMGSLIAVVVIAAAVFAVIGRERVWRQFGSADLGPVDFASLQRRTTPNDALVCDPEHCTAKADIAAPVYAMPAAALSALFQQAIAGEPQLEKVAADAPQLS